MTSTGGNSSDASSRFRLDAGNASEWMAGDGNGSITPTGIPREITFNDDSLVSVIAYSILFAIALVGNLTVVINLFKSKKHRSRVHLFILHLAIADLIVTLIMLPMEIGWHITVAWKAGDIACRVMMFCRAFGFYLSTFILITISVDRYFAIVHPLSLTDAGKRSRIMLSMAWIFSLVASIPQSVIFHVEHHPQFPWFSQCVTFNFFPTPSHELAYNLFTILTLYGIPLLIIVAAYTLILLEMSKKTRESRGQLLYQSGGTTRSSDGSMRRSSVGWIKKARIKTLKMTIVIVAVFIMCWTPHFIMSAWWWFHKESAKNIDPKIQRGLFIFAVSNTCLNPIIYGMFTLNIQQDIKHYCCHATWWRRETPKLSPYHHIHVVSNKSSSLKVNKSGTMKLNTPVDVTTSHYLHSALSPLTILDYECSPRPVRGLTYIPVAGEKGQVICSNSILSGP